ncbi:hypothetical protein AVEN_195352-1 [Araneus ventricosus]|uniref:Uncharacterized protein n=1 Tax=Araneus ventricosus TaxID=182803 RepID=A0A4Y2DK54_ARAVE|nr:hypothetical protein AVEN_195352-1 [Araneus ventricosus]
MSRFVISSLVPQSGSTSIKIFDEVMTSEYDEQRKVRKLRGHNFLKMRDASSRNALVAAAHRNARFELFIEISGIASQIVNSQVRNGHHLLQLMATTRRRKSCRCGIWHRDLLMKRLEGGIVKWNFMAAQGIEFGWNRCPRRIHNIDRRNE